MGTPVLAHALAAASRGLAVIPLSRAKLPALRSPHRPDGHGAPADVGVDAGAGSGSDSGAGAGAGADAEERRFPCQGECGLPGHGVYDASTDPDTIRALFAAAPWATGYGIACGRPPLYLIGLDLDVKHGTDPLAALDRLTETHGFTVPETTTVLTPSGGRHLWLRGSAGATVPNSAGRVAPGIDVRGLGGYLVGPGSVTVRGTYRLAPGSLTRAPAPAPPALLDLLAPPPPAARPPRTTHDVGDTALVHFVRGAAVGQRNARLFWAACRAYESGRGDALSAALTEAAVATGLPEREALATIASASRRAARFTSSP
ncbi:bifunctional DNA primase/polymerase [Streptomyces sp. NPDC054796]